MIANLNQYKKVILSIDYKINNKMERIIINTELMFSSKDMTWETPQDLFDKLNKDFILILCNLS